MSGLRPLIAVVDDEAPIRKALSRLLRSADMDVLSYPSGAEFLAAYPAMNHDCVILDLHMPVMDGFMVQQRLNTFAKRPPVIVITAHDTHESRHKAMSGRPAAYLRKPMTDEALIDAIQQAITGSGGQACTGG